MYRLDDKNLIFSASDLVAFLGCRHATYLDRRRIDGLVAPPAETSDPYLDLLQEKGLEHERSLRDRFQSEGKRVVDIATDGLLEERTAHTRAAMEDGADVIYQGAFLSGRWHGYADFLLRVEGTSRLGAFHYEPLDTKLAHSARPKHLMQLGIYARLLADVQGRPPERVHVALGNGDTLAFALREFDSYLEGAIERFQQFIEAIPASSVGEPCKACEQCRWRERCEADWIAAGRA